MYALKTKFLHLRRKCTLIHISWFLHIHFRHVRIDANNFCFLRHARPSVRQSICPSVSMYQRDTRWADSVTFDIGDFYEYLTRKRKFVLNQANISGTLH